MGYKDFNVFLARSFYGPQEGTIEGMTSVARAITPPPLPSSAISRSHHVKVGGAGCPGARCAPAASGGAAATAHCILDLEQQAA